MSMKRAIKYNLASGACALGLVLAAGIQPADARGPRASVASSTTCELELGDPGSGVADLVIMSTLTDKSSGSVVAELRVGSEIRATSKLEDQKGNSSTVFSTVLIGGLPADIGPAPDLEEVEATFDLCANFATVQAARELNGMATLFYGTSGGSGETRVLVNRCTDDPDTFDNEGSIKVAHVFDDIAEACGF